MPEKPLRNCHAPGCNQLCRSKYCDDHQDRDLIITNGQDRERGSAHSRGYDTTWRKLRLMILRRTPLCTVCGDYKDLEVHHIKPISEGGKRLDPKNLQVMCGFCHKKHHSGRKA